MTFKNRAEVPFIGGPLAGTLAKNGRAIYRSAIDSRALPAGYGHRWVIHHQHEKDSPKVAAKLAGLYLRQSSSGYTNVYVWAPIWQA